jgi:hypothetical protein
MSDSLLLPLSWFLSRVFPLGHCRFCCCLSLMIFVWLAPLCSCKRTPWQSN